MNENNRTKKVSITKQRQSNRIESNLLTSLQHIHPQEEPDAIWEIHRTHTITLLSTRLLLIQTPPLQKKRGPLADGE